MSDLDAMYWLDRGLAEIDAAETLDEAREEARGLTIMAAVRMFESLELHIVGNRNLTRDEAHPLQQRVREFKTVYNKLHDVYADIRRSESIAEESVR